MKDVKRMEEQTDEVCDKCGKPMVIKWGRYGKFLACSGYPECKNTRQLAGSEGDGGPELHEDVAKEVCANDGQPMVLQEGPLRPVPRLLQLPRVQGDQAPRARRRTASCRWRRSAHRRGLPRLRQADLMWRRGRFGTFIACSDYPNCKYIKKKEAKEIGLACPECGQGQVVERKGRWGAVASTAASAIPKCKFTAYHRPIPEPCPDCGRALPRWRRRPRRRARSSSAANEACHYKRRGGV